MKIKTKLPLVFDISRGTFVDGPGIRTIVFFKGCPLRCVWCQNPESHRLAPEFVALSDHDSQQQTIGKYYSPEELIEILSRDIVFYETSGGGVTYSGGEPLLFIDYLARVSRLLKQQYIHITIETCGYFNFEQFEQKLLPFVDLIFFDLKLFNEEKHWQYTGKSNKLILQNFEKLLARDIKLLPRIPLIPGFTATEENLRQIAQFLKKHGITEYELLPYNPSGLNKWKRLGKTTPQNLTDKPMTLEQEDKWRDFFKASLLS